MGCKQVKVNPTEPVNEIELQQTQTDITKGNVAAESSLIRSNRQARLSYISPFATSTLTTFENTNVTQPRNHSNPTIPIPLLSERDTITTAIEDNRHNEPHSILAATGEPAVFRQSNNPRRVTINDDLSVYENSSVTIESDDLEESCTAHRSFPSSASQAEVLEYSNDAIQRFMSARPNRPTHRESTHHGMWSEQDDLYSVRDSIVSSVSADSEGSVTNPPRAPKAIFVRPKKSYLKKKNLVKQSFSDHEGSELRNVTDAISAPVGMHVMTERLVSNLGSAKLSNPGFTSHGAISETTSESDENEF
ncbi:unnamed protein product [Adineta ricciae]|uniref:Uncharacterized protein n=1 Tax=Adineta ricciae TaxID=249248 RepID=A0A814XXW0_ADIRI|nr:unnamed protein product [Adineta ricciae]CAF1421210.1 unnamed protein product [Adineta ricciae]